MVDFEKALKTMLSVKPLSAVEIRDLSECVGRVVAEPVPARIGLPPFAKSAMDGFALMSTDHSDSYLIIETIPAGRVPEKSLSPGSCSRIMTGAMMPEGADTVVRVEYTSVDGGRMRITTPEPYSNVIEREENVRPGDTIFDPGVVRPEHIGIFAEQGIDSLTVRIPPTVGLLTTGSELRDPGDALEPGEIYNSNGPQLCAQIRATGSHLRYYGIIKDTPEEVGKALETAVAECDVVILTGGVSMGDYDFVPDAVEHIGAELLFHKVAVKPGKPLLFARAGSGHIVGLPGNPVSTFIIFEVMVKPMIYKLMGIDHTPKLTTGILTADIRRRDITRLEFIPVRQNGDTVSPVRYHGSSHLRALGSANALVSVAVGVDSVAKGTRVDVRSF